jgi:AcrR family transcriptional regulator
MPRSQSDEDKRKARASQRRQERRTQILAAARKVFSARGYHAASVSDILEEARVARGTFYLYFPSKRAIFEDLLEQMFSQITGAVRRIQTDAEQSPLEQMFGIAWRIIDVLMTNRELTIILLREAVGLDADFDQKLTAFYQRLATIIEGALHLGQTMGLVRPANTRLVAQCVLGSVKEVMLSLLTAQGADRFDLSRDALVREIVEYNLYGIFAHPGER